MCHPGAPPAAPPGSWPCQGSLLTRHHPMASLLTCDSTPCSQRRNLAHGQHRAQPRLSLPSCSPTHQAGPRAPLPSSFHCCYFTFLLFTPRDFLWGLGQFAYILIYKKLSGAGCCSESDLPILNLKELNNFPLLLRCVESDSCSSHHLSLEEGAGGSEGWEEPSRTFTGSPQPHGVPTWAWRSHPPIQAALAVRNRGIWALPGSCPSSDVPQPLWSESCPGQTQR